METDQFVVKNEDSSTYTLTRRGKIAAEVKEVHGLVFARMLDPIGLQTMTAKQLVAVFSCFTNVTVPDELRSLVPYSGNAQVNSVVKKIKMLYDLDLSFEENQCLDTGTNYEMHYDLLAYVMQWCDCENSQQCTLLLKKMEQEKGIFLGEFVKALLKINNIVAEMEKIAEMLGDIAFLNQLNQIAEYTLKYVATNQSLYV